MSSHQKSVKKPFLLYNFPQGVLFCQNKSQLSNLQNGHREKLFFNPPTFDHLKTTQQVSKSCFPIRRVLKCLFCYTTSPRGSCLAKLRVSCQTFKMDIERSFSLAPHFWPFKNHSTGQKSCFLIRRVLKSLLSIWPSPRGLVLLK